MTPDSMWLSSAQGWRKHPKIEIELVTTRENDEQPVFFSVPEFQTNLRGLVAKKLVFPNDGNPTVNSFSNTQSPNPS